MLTKTEKAVMGYLYQKCQNKKGCITTYQEIILSLSHKVKLTESRLKEIIGSLEQDDYFEIISTDRHGQQVLVVTLSSKGKSFPREVVQSARQLKNKLIFATVGAVFSYVIGRILYLVFT